MESIAAILRNDVDVTAVVPILGRVPTGFKLDFLRGRGVVAGKLITSSTGHRPVVHAIPQFRIVNRGAPMDAETLALLSS